MTTLNIVLTCLIPLLLQAQIFLMIFENRKIRERLKRLEELVEERKDK